MAAKVKPIRRRRDYEAALKEIERLWGAKTGTRDGDRLDVLANDQWRVIFRWVNGEAHDVRITDYH